MNILYEQRELGLRHYKNQSSLVISMNLRDFASLSMNNVWAQSGILFVFHVEELNYVFIH